MANERFILAVGRIERALSKLEQFDLPNSDNNPDANLLAKHERLKSEARATIHAIDSVLNGGAN
jgi:hypothetical protein